MEVFSVMKMPRLLTTDILQHGLSSDPRQGIRGPKHQPDINQTKNARRSRSKRLNDYLTIHMSAKSNLGFLNLSKFYRVSQKNLDSSLMGHKGAKSGMKNSGFYLSSEHKIMGLSEITHVTINPVLFMSN